MKSELIEGEDYYYNDEGYFVFTAKYHLQRGACCGNGCLNCPYVFDRLQEPKNAGSSFSVPASPGSQ